MTEKTKRARHFPCPFCVEGHTYPAGIQFCEGNPDREANRKKRSELNRLSYNEERREKLTAGGRTEIARIRKSNVTKKMWESGRLGNTAGANNGMYGKKRSLESRLKQSITKTKTAANNLHKRIAKTTQTAVHNENLVAPIFGSAADFFNKKIDKDGWIEVDSDSWSPINDEFDPFH